MKRIFALILSLMMLGSLFLAGCGGAKEAGKNDGGKVTIRFAHWRGEDSETFKKIIAQFEKENPNISVVQSVDGTDQYKTKIQAELQSAEGPDVFTTFPGTDFANMSKANLYVDLTGLPFLKGFNNDLMLPGQKDGKQLAIPYQLVYNDPVYNKAIFAKLGLDPNTKDWNEFLALCQKLKDSGITPIILDSEIGFTQFTYPMMMNNMPSADALVRVEKGELKLTDPWFVKMLSQYKELNDKGFFQRDVLGTKKAGAAALFAQEKGAMLAQGSFMMAANKEQNPKLEQGLLAPITVAASEKKYDGIHNVTFMLGINAKSKKQEAAKTFLAYLMNPEVAAMYANATGQMLTVPGTKYQSAELAEQASWLNKKTLFLPRSTLTIREVETAIHNAVSDVFGGMDPQAAAEKAQKVTDMAIKK